MSGVDLHLTVDGRHRITEQIYGQIRTRILDRLLRPGEALPATRELAARLGVSRNTVSVAYDRLTAEGFLTSRVGVGTYVSVLPTLATAEADMQPSADCSPLRPRPIWEALPDPWDLTTPAEFDFMAGLPDGRLFPFGTWRGLIAAQFRRSAAGADVPGDPAGDPRLRAAIARHIGVSRAVPASADEVLVTSGIQQAVDLVGRVLLAPGDVVAVEDPGYPLISWLFESSGVRVVGVPVDSEGLVVDRLPADARLVYVSPSHQFPLGWTMSLSRRLDLLAWAERTGAAVLEDDYDCEFRYGGRPVEPLRSLDREGRVIYLGSFSKTMLPSLRLGFCVAPPSLFAALRKAKYLADWHTPAATQAALAQFIDDGLFARHLRRMRGVYRARRDRIAVALERDLADHLEPIASVAGLHLSAWLRPGAAADDLAVTRRARKLGVAVAPLSVFGIHEPARPGLMIGFGRADEERIDEGLRRLRRCLDRT
jgi:GntR family transcriptional regulator/MocR family aminotransferase